MTINTSIRLPRAVSLSIYIGISALLFTACSDNDDPAGLSPQTSYIEFGSSISADVTAASRVNGTAWETTDRVGVYLTTPAYAAVPDAENKTYRPKAGVPNVLEADGEDQRLYYPTNGSNVRFIAYHPYRQDISSYDHPITIAPVQSADALKAADLLWCKTSTDFNKESATNPELNFVHQLTKVAVHITFGAGMDTPEMQQVNITHIPTTATFNLVDAQISAFGNVQPVTLHAESNTYQAIIIPHGVNDIPATSSRELTFTFTEDGGAPTTLSHPVTNVEFTPNKVYNYTVTIQRKEVELSCTIEDWDSDTVDEDATLGDREVIPGANCYILPPGGHSVLIPVSRAAYYYDLVNRTDEFAPATADVLWSDVAADGHNVYGNANAPIANVVLTDDEKHIKVTTGTNPALEGNAVIALRNSVGDILWSWHIWLTDYNPNASLKYNHVHPNKPVFMDRNLGALSATPPVTPAGMSNNTTASATADDLKSFGLYYQWGRKDPFPRVTGATFKKDASGVTTINHLSTDYPKSAFWYKDVSGYTYFDASSEKIPADLVKAANTYHTALSEPNVFYKQHNVDPWDWCSDGTTKIPNIPLRWNNANGKALDDPCPQGWKVPNSGGGNASPWNGLGNTTFPWKDDELGRSNNAIGYWPASGYRVAGSGMFSYTGANGYCWSSAVTGANGHGLYFHSTFVYPSYNGSRAYGFVVRCVPD